MLRRLEFLHLQHPHAHERPAPPPAAPLFLEHSTWPEICLLGGSPAAAKGKSPSCWTHSGFFAASSEGAAAGTRAAPSPIEAVRATANLFARDFPASAKQTPRAQSQSSAISAAVPSGGNSPAGAVSCGSAGPAAAEHCEAARRNSRKLPPEDLARAASAPARDTPGSNTAPSNRADIASCFFLASSEMGRRWEGVSAHRRKGPAEKSRTSPVEPSGLCAGVTCVSRKNNTISSGAVSRRDKTIVPATLRF